MVNSLAVATVDESVVDDVADWISKIQVTSIKFCETTMSQSPLSVP